MYDLITRFINGLNDPLLTGLAQLIDNDFFYGGMLIGLLLGLERDNDKRGKVILALVMALLVSLALKEAFHTNRPCDELLAKIPCPDGYAFPSIHTILAFTLAAAFLYRPNYGVYLLFALMVAASRIYLGVHTLEDVAASLALAVIVYVFADRVWERQRRNIQRALEWIGKTSGRAFHGR